MVISGKKLYTLWGYDKSDEDETKVVVSNEAQLLLFKTPSSLLTYIKSASNVFDKKYTLSWLKKLSKPTRSHTTINIDLLENAKLDIDDKDSFTALIDAFSIVDDYAHCANNKKLLKICMSKQLVNLFDLHCNMYLWQPIEKNIQKNLRLLDKEKVINSLNQLYSTFKDSICIN